MKVTKPAGNRAATGIAGRIAGLSLWRVVVWVVVISVVAGLLLLAMRPQYLQQASIRLEQRWGHAFGGYDRALKDKWAIALGNYFREAVEGVPEIPELVIDVPFKEMTKVYAKRSEALATGHLVQGSDDFVKGEIRFEGRTIPIKLRLKGDWTDHLMGRKWSFRIRVRGDDQLFGMRRFSIQHPNTRGFQSELLYFHVLRSYGVMVPRYSFVNVTLNGESMGLMALEEFFAKEMLEYNRRREGVIVRFDESLVWDAKDSIYGEDIGWGGAFDHFSNARADVIGSSRVAETPALARQYAVAEGLLNGFVEGTLTSSEVFDVQQTAAFIAVADLFGAVHSIAWTNMRFYLNPITLHLEPIPFDASLTERYSDDVSVISSEPVLVKMLSDPRIWQAYTAILSELGAKVDDGTLLADLSEVEQSYLPLLQTEFRMLGSYPLDYLAPRIEALLARATDGPAPDYEDLALDHAHEREEYPLLAHVGLLEAREPPTLRIDNAIPRDVELLAIQWVNNAAERSVSAVHKEIFPFAVPARGIGSPPWRYDLRLAPPPEEEGWELVVTARMTGREWTRTLLPVIVRDALAQAPIPAGDLQAQLAAHEFLRLDAVSGVVTIPAGSWEVQQPLIIPRGYSLLIEAGATLTFAADALLVTHGPFHSNGMPDQPVTLQAGAGSTWPGMVVMAAGGESVVRYTRISDTSGAAYGSWVLTGGVNFYASPVLIEDSLLTDSHGEDALNIIQSEFTIRNTEIRETASDAFDSDFSTGAVIGSRFIGIGRAGGGDAVDVSGSEISVSDSSFVDVSDKALSVGERSTMQARNVTMEKVGTGAAAKDGSLLKLDDSIIKAADFAALTAYIKKPEYGPAEIVAANVTIEATETVALAQTGSRITIDGAAVATEDVDVDALYETVMRKGLR